MSVILLSALILSLNAYFSNPYYISTCRWYNVVLVAYILGLTKYGCPGIDINYTNIYAWVSDSSNSWNAVFFFFDGRRPGIY